MSQSATSVKPTLLLDLGNLHTLVIGIIRVVYCIFGNFDALPFWQIKQILQHYL